jgi:hypothetical protein
VQQSGTRYGRPAPKYGKSSCTRIVWASASAFAHGRDGTISGPGNVRTSWELAEQVSLIATRRGAVQAVNGAHWLDIRFSGWISPTRFSRTPFIHDAALPGMLHGGAAIGAVGGETHRFEGGWRAHAGLVAIVRDGNFVGSSAKPGRCAGRPQSLAQVRPVIRSRFRRRPTGCVPEPSRRSRV